MNFPRNGTSSKSYYERAQLIGQEVCAVSSKHNTTRTNARAVLNSGDVQIVFLDTPGVVNMETAKKFKLG
jgi:GTPase Era involved in 16S rRNA processing